MGSGRRSFRSGAPVQDAVALALVNVVVFVLLTPLFDWNRCARPGHATARWMWEHGVPECLLPADTPEDVVPLQLPCSGPWTPDPDPRKNRLTVNITWDPRSQKPTIRVKRSEFTLGELKAWLFPIARSKIEPRTKFSKIPICVRATRGVPFGEVQKVLDVCADKDIQIVKVRLEMAPHGR